MQTDKSHKILQWLIGGASLAIIALYWYASIPFGEGFYSLRINPYVLLVLFAIICNVILFILLVRMRSRIGAVSWFSIIPLLNVYWLTTVVMLVFANTPEVGQYWQHAAPAAWVPIPLALLYFALSYIEDIDLPRKPLLWLPPLFAVFVLLFIGGDTSLLAYENPVNQKLFYWGYESDLTKWSVYAYAWSILLIVTALVLLIQAYRRSTNKIEKRQRRIFVIGVAGYISVVIIFDILIASLPLTYNIELPPTGFIYSSFLAIVIGYGIIKYGIFKVSPASLSGTILQSLTEAVVATNTELKVEFTNQGTESMTNYGQGKLKGAHISMLFNSETFRSIVNNMHQEKELLVLDETEIKNEKGELIPVTLSVGRVADDRGKLAGYIFVFANISELKKKSVELEREKASVEQKVRDRTKELSEEHARLTASINSLNIGFLMTGADDQILTINPTATDLLAKLAKAQDIAVPDAWTIPDISKVLAKEQTIVDSLSSGHKQNESFEFKELQIDKWYVHVFIAPVTEQGSVIGAVVLLEDITEEKVANRSKDEFFIIASHELRTPLTKIRGSAEVIQDVYKSSITSEEARRMLGEIEQSSGHLLDVVNDFIQMSELEQSKVKLDPTEFNVSELIHETVAVHKEKSKKPEVQFKIQTHGNNDLRMTADRDRTKQILDAYLNNAYKFTDKGSITVELAHDDQTITLRVADTGKGIKVENQSLLFRKFQQAGSSLLSRDGEGTGLGLYIVDLIAKAMGGTASLESTKDGEGSVFSVVLPITSQIMPVVGEKEMSGDKV